MRAKPTSDSFSKPHSIELVSFDQKELLPGPNHLTHHIPAPSPPPKNTLQGMPRPPGAGCQVRRRLPRPCPWHGTPTTHAPATGSRSALTSGSMSGYLRPLLLPRHLVFPPSSSWHQNPFLGSNLWRWEACGCELAPPAPSHSRPSTGTSGVAGPGRPGVPPHPAARPGTAEVGWCLHLFCLWAPLMAPPQKAARELGALSSPGCAGSVPAANAKRDASRPPSPGNLPGAQGHVLSNPSAQERGWGVEWRTLCFLTNSPLIRELYLLLRLSMRITAKPFSFFSTFQKGQSKPAFRIRSHAGPRGCSGERRADALGAGWGPQQHPNSVPGRAPLRRWGVRAAGKEREGRGRRDSEGGTEQLQVLMRAAVTSWDQRTPGTEPRAPVQWPREVGIVTFMPSTWGGE